MTVPLEDYALIGDCQTAALVSKEGSIDWLCFPRFDSAACFCALLGNAENGYWRLTPEAPVLGIERRYRADTLILETEYETASGRVRVTDWMPPRSDYPDLIRTVTGVRGEVPMRMELVIRFDYGDVIPWVIPCDGGIRAIAGPDMLWLNTSVPLATTNEKIVSRFTIRPGQTDRFVLIWHPSHQTVTNPIEPKRALAATEEWWRAWSGHCTYVGPWQEAVVRSLITLKALTYAPTGGIVAAPTTSLPECLGGQRNWDYRYCWLRDATFTLYALTMAGYIEEAKQWSQWLLRAVAGGEPKQMQTLYGVAGERRLEEITLDWLSGYEGSRPVRVGNAAYQQFQLDIYGELMDALHLARRAGLKPREAGWQLQRNLLAFVESVWDSPDEGIWEVRGPRRHFTYFKVMAWVALDRAIRACERFRLEGAVERWQALRERIHREICEQGFDTRQGSFVQYYGGKGLDASLLLIPLVGFLPPSDPRILGTLEAIEHQLVIDGFVARYLTEPEVDGLPAGEGAFSACSFWLADNYALVGRWAEARALFERLLSLRSDLGLLAEQYDPKARRLIGNYPQALLHIALINTAYNLSAVKGPAHDRHALKG